MFFRNPVHLRHSADAMLSQAAPVQNTWYPVLATQSRTTRLYLITVAVGTANETLEVRILVDGLTISGAVNATFGTAYSAYINYGISAESLSLVAGGRDVTYIVEGRNVSVDVRKTSATGAGALTAKVTYGTRY